MPALPTLTVTDTASNNSSFQNAAGGSPTASDLEAIASADDADYWRGSTDGNGVYRASTFTTMPTDFGAITALNVNVRYRQQGRVNDTLSLVLQVYAADNSTAYTNAITISNITTTSFTTSGAQAFTINATGLAASKANWDSAKIRVTQNISRSAGADGCHVQVSALELTGTYDVAVAVSQEAYRFRTHDNADVSANDATFGVAQNTTTTLDVSRRFRLRVQIGTSGNKAATAYKLQWNKNGGSWTDVTVENPSDSSLKTLIDPVELVATSGFTNAAATTDVLTGGTGSFVAGAAYDTQNASSTIALNNQHTELEWCLWLNRWNVNGTTMHWADGDTVNFRVVYSSGSAPLETYGVTISATVNFPDGYIGGQAVETMGYVGPFSDSNGNWYTFVEASEASPLFVVAKSTDGGITWSALTSGRPTQNDLESLSVIKVGTELYILHQDSGLYFYRFGMSDHATNADQWLETTQIIAAASMPTTDQQCGLHRKANGDLVAVFNYDSTNNKIGFRRRISGTWDGATTQMWSGTGVSFDGNSSVMDPNTDITYVFAKDDTSGAIYGKAILSNGTLQNLFADAETTNGTTVVSSSGSATGIHYRTALTNSVYWNDGSPRVLLGYVKATTLDLAVKKITVGSGGSVGSEVVINDSMDVASGNVLSRGIAASLVVTSSGNITALYALESTDAEDNTLYYSQSTDGGATWSADAAAPTSSWGNRVACVSANKLSYSGTDYVAYYFYDATRYQENTSATGHGGGNHAGFNWVSRFSLATGNNYNESCSDALNVTDSNTGALSALGNTSDTAAITDSLTAPLSAVESRSDTATITDSVADGYLLTESRADTLTITDSTTGTLANVENKSDTASITDSAVATLTLPESRSDTSTVTDTRTDALTLTESRSDTLTITDSETDNPVALESRSDTFTFTDSLAAPLSMPEARSDALALTDSLSAPLAAAESPLSALLATDAASHALSGAASLSSLLALSDSLSDSLAPLEARSDALTLTDTVSAVLAASAAETSTYTVVDLVAAALSAVEARSDSLTITDSLTDSHTAAGQENRQDTYTFTDSVTATVSASFSASDTASTTDSLTDVLAAVESRADTYSVADSRTDITSAGFIESLNDTLSLTDSSASSVSMVAQAASTFTATDSLAALAALVELPSTLLTISDSVDTGVAAFFITSALVGTVQVGTTAVSALAPSAVVGTGMDGSTEAR